VKQLTELIM